MAGLAAMQATVTKHAPHGRPAPGTLGCPDGERERAACPDAGAAGKRAIGQRPAPGQGDSQPGEVDAGARGVAGLDGARVALDELRLPADVEVVQGQPAVPAQVRPPGPRARGRPGDRRSAAVPGQQRSRWDQPTSAQRGWQ